MWRTSPPCGRRSGGGWSPGGDFVFSVEHPIFTARGDQDWLYGPGGEIDCFPVDNYFFEGRRRAVFLGEPVTKYHRTLTTYLDGLLTGGFALRRVAEGPCRRRRCWTSPECGMSCAAP